MKRVAVAMLCVCLLSASVFAATVVSVEEPLYRKSQLSRVRNAANTGTLVFESDEEESHSKISVRSLPSRFPSYVQQIVDSNGDAYVLNHRTKTLYVYDKDDELKLSKDVEWGTSDEQADWRITLTDRFVWLWIRDQQQFVKLNKNTLEPVEFIEDFTNATAKVEMAGGRMDDLYVWFAPYIWRSHAGQLARVDLRQFGVTSDDVALTIANDGLVYAVAADSAQLFVFDAELEEGKAYRLDAFDAALPVAIYVWGEQIYLYDAERRLWTYDRPIL